MNYAYTIEVALHEWLLRSPHRTVDGRAADYYYVPCYLACTILPVYDWLGPAEYMSGYPMRPVTAMRMVHDAWTQVVTRWGYWNATGGRTHIFLFSHDEGACWAPLEVYRRSTNPTILTNLVVT